MIFTDPAVVEWLAPPKWFTYSMEVAFAAGVIVVGKLWIRFLFRKGEALEASSPESPGPKPSDEV
jgi:hypothetical protein